MDNKKQQNLILWVIVSVVCISLVLIIFLPHDMEGRVIDKKTGNPLANLEVEVGGKSSITGTDGDFRFEKVFAWQKLVIKGNNLYEGSTLLVFFGKEIVVEVNPSINLVAMEILQDDFYRKYRNVYENFSEEVKSEFSIEQYLEYKNKARDELTDRGCILESLPEIANVETLSDYTHPYLEKSFAEVDKVTTTSHCRKDANIKIDKHLYFVLRGGKRELIWEE